jgi:hypothetical protein
VKTEGHQELETLDRLRRVESKFTVLCKAIFGLIFKVLDWESRKEEEAMEVIGTLGS